MFNRSSRRWSPSTNLGYREKLCGEERRATRVAYQLREYYSALSRRCNGAKLFYTDENGRWFNIGDHGIMDDEGLIFILGRSKDVIKRGGVCIMPAVLESCIEKYTTAQVSIRYP
jgi:acyl-CoA synthetase (AMP-forming)/AMP-acid ligase II